jgi:hypothetical protein
VKATVGDRLTVPGRHVGDPVRQGVVTAVRGSETDPLYVVRWEDGHEGTCSPGAEARVLPPAATDGSR